MIINVQGLIIAQNTLFSLDRLLELASEIGQPIALIAFLGSLSLSIYYFREQDKNKRNLDYLKLLPFEERGKFIENLLPELQKGLSSKQKVKVLMDTNKRNERKFIISVISAIVFAVLLIVFLAFYEPPEPKDPTSDLSQEVFKLRREMDQMNMQFERTSAIPDLTSEIQRQAITIGNSSERLDKKIDDYYSKIDKSYHSNLDSLKIYNAFVGCISYNRAAIIYNPDKIKSFNNESKRISLIQEMLKYSLKSVNICNNIINDLEKKITNQDKYYEWWFSQNNYHLKTRFQKALALSVTAYYKKDEEKRKEVKEIIDNLPNFFLKTNKVCEIYYLEWAVNSSIKPKGCNNTKLGFHIRLSPLRSETLLSPTLWLTSIIKWVLIIGFSMKYI